MGEQRRYIVSRAYDLAFFLLPPMLALLAGISISGTSFSNDVFEFAGQEVTGAGLAVGAFIHAHLVLVFVRSHGNPDIRAAHPVRFFVVPPLLYVAMLASPWILVGVSVLATFWDVYHSGMQTFGLGRIYDMRAGNDPKAGRGLDWALNQLLYAGPIVAGATMLDHFEDFREFDAVRPDTFFSRIPAQMEGIQGTLAQVLIAGGTVFVAAYLLRYWQLARRGYRVSPMKVWLLASTGFCSVYTWGFNSFGEAFFIMNAFHAFQYFGIVWAFERENLADLAGLKSRPGLRPLLLPLFVMLPLGYGVWVEAMDANVTALYALTIVVSIMHFWYDGFVWSVRRKQV